MALLKSARHHWWPETVSKRWKDANGITNWLLPDGEVRPLAPAKLGAIRNGHHIKLGGQPGESTVWDQSFEKEFDRADSGFSGVIDWAEGLQWEDRAGAALRERFVPQKAADEQVRALVEGIVSLAIRSPRTREGMVSLAEDFRGPLPERERSTLIGANLRHCQRMFVDSIGTRGKFVVISSPLREFIFGDGFFHNFTSPAMAPHNPKILAPLTPRISVLYTRPMRYLTEPKLMTLVISSAEANELNNVVQVYSSNAIYYRSDRPTITDEYRAAEHRRYATHDNPVDQLIDSVPGVPPRDTSLGVLLNR